MIMIKLATIIITFLSQLFFNQGTEKERSKVLSLFPCHRFLLDCVQMANTFD